MIPRFFIDRPIFATVLSVLVTLAGGLAAFTLPISQYPVVTPPTIQIDCNYPGASSEVVSKTIAAPIEQQVNGVENMLYMSSQCTADGSYTCTITFKTGTNLNMAQVRVQNRVNLALPQLPDVVRATGITTRKRSPELLMTVALSSPDGVYKQLYLSNYAVLHLKEVLARIPGISDVTVFGQKDYALRVWVNPEKLAGLGLTPGDVVAAIREQNAPVVAGQVGQPPAGDGQPIQLTVSAVGRLVEVEQFEQVVVKRGPQGAVVKVRDVARVELGAKSADVVNRFDMKETIGLAIFPLPDANALEIAAAVKAHMAVLAKDFPTGMMYEIGYDTSPFIGESIKEVLKSLQTAVVLVAIVVLVFLQSWRAAIIPLAAVPVAIVGTFAAMAAAGFTINNLTLFGLVLAVGIVVDDAIVVVEATQHQLEKGYSPREATIRAMDEVAGPIVAVGVVLSAVFIPCAFLSGLVGAFFRQFALTIAVSTLISTFNSLTLSPALCAILMKGQREPAARRGFLAPVGAVLFWPLALFNRAFAASGRWYVKVVGFGMRVPLLVLAGYAGLVATGVGLFQSLPTGFIPQQDKGYLLCSVQLPDAAAAGRTQDVIQKIARIALDTPGVAHGNAVAGNSFALSAYGSNFGSMFVILDGFDKRRDSPELYADRIAAKLRARFEAAVPEAQVSVFGAPAVSGLGRAGGFRLMIEDRGDAGTTILQEQADNFIRVANQQPQVVGLFTVFKTKSPQIYLDVDRMACATHGVDLGDVYSTLQGSMGSRYVNDFNRFGRTWQVNVQAEREYRDRLDDIRKLKVRNRHGEMVPLAAVVRVQERNAPLVISRYNMYPAAAVNGNVAPGTSTGDAIAMLERLADRELTRGVMAYEWTELTFLEKQSRNTGALVFAMSVAFVFLVLAALYESWAFPLAVILVVPVCVTFSLAGIWLTDPGSFAQSLVEWNADPAVPWWLKPNPWAAPVADRLDSAAGEANRVVTAAGIRKQDVNVFTQVGFVVLIGLACKNAILIVEFAKVARDKGVELRQAVLDACQLRYRPIMMTSVAFMLGVLPLAIARGAGSEMRQAIGVAVLAGMFGVTLFGVVLTPVFFALVDRLTNGRVFHNRYVRGVGDALLYVLRFRFVRPLAGAAWTAVGRGRTTPRRG